MDAAFVLTPDYNHHNKDVSNLIVSLKLSNFFFIVDGVADLKCKNACILNRLS